MSSYSYCYLAIIALIFTLRRTERSVVHRCMGWAYQYWKEMCQLCSQQWYRSFHRYLWPSKWLRQLFLLKCFMSSYDRYMLKNIFTSWIGLVICWLLLCNLMLLIPFYIFSLNHRHSLVLERMCHLSIELATLTHGIRPPMTPGVQVKETRYESRPYNNLSK